MRCFLNLPAGQGRGSGAALALALASSACIAQDGGQAAALSEPSATCPGQEVKAVALKAEAEGSWMEESPLRALAFWKNKVGQQVCVEGGARARAIAPI